MNVAAMALAGSKLAIDPNLDVNETAAIVYDAKRERRQERGADPRRRQPEELRAADRAADPGGARPAEKGHDYFLQVTDARPDTGGLSGATPAEAVSWGKIDPEQLPNTVVCYTDSTIALPLLVAVRPGQPRKPRPLKRLYDRREAMLARLRDDYLARWREA